MDCGLRTPQPKYIGIILTPLAIMCVLFWFESLCSTSTWLCNIGQTIFYGFGVHTKRRVVGILMEMGGMKARLKIQKQIKIYSTINKG